MQTLGEDSPPLVKSSDGRDDFSQSDRFTYGSRLSLYFRSDPPDESGGSYESECEPEGLYGALQIVPGGPYGAEK